MKKHFFLQISLIFALAMGQLVTHAQTYYVPLKPTDPSGIDIAPYQTELNAAAQPLCALFDSLGFAGQFKVFTAGFYVVQESYSDYGYIEAFSLLKDSVLLASPYYLLIGRESNANGIFVKWWIDLKMPNTGKFACIDEQYSTFRKEIVEKVEVFADRAVIDNPSLAGNGFRLIEKSIFDTLTSYVSSITECCNAPNKGATCISCFFSAQEFQDKVDNLGLYGNSCNIISVKNTDNESNPELINRIVFEAGEEIDIDAELDALSQVFLQENQGSTIKIFKWRYPSHCGSFEETYDAYIADASDAKMIIGLIEKENGEGEIVWESSGEKLIHRGVKGIKYQVRKDGETYVVKLEIKYKLLDLTKSSSTPDFNLSLLAQKLNSMFESFRYSGNFDLTVAGTNKTNKKRKCTGSTVITVEAVSKFSNIYSNDHVGLIVDAMTSRESVAGYAGFALKGENVYAVNKKDTYHTNNYIRITKLTHAHEIGHNLSLNDDYKSPIVMGDSEHARLAMNYYDVLTIYGKFASKEQSGSWRNYYNTAGNTQTQIKEFLKMIEAKYDEDKIDD